MAIYRLGARQWQSNDRRGVASNGFWFLFLVSCFEAIPVKPSYQSRNCLKNSSPVSFSIQLVNWCVERKKKKRTRECRFQKKGNSSSSSSIWKITIRGRGRVSRLVTRRLNEFKGGRIRSLLYLDLDPYAIAPISINNNFC